MHGEIRSTLRHSSRFLIVRTFLHGPHGELHNVEIIAAVASVRAWLFLKGSMKTRFLSIATVAAVFAATGCSGGGAGTAPTGLAPAVPLAHIATNGTASISASFTIPVSAAQAAARSAGRRAQYLSPGTNGISILLGDGSSVTGSAGLSGTAQLTGSVNETGAAAQSANVSFLSASNSTTPVVGQTLQLTHLNSAGNTPSGTNSAVLTITAILSSTIVTGTFAASAGATGNAAAGGQPAGYNFLAGDLITFTATGPSTTGQQFIVGNQNTAAPLTPTAVIKAPIPSTIFGATASSTVSYSFTQTVPTGFSGNFTYGYYTFNVTISNITAGKTYTLGVVTNDTAHNNFVLSEAQKTISTPAAGGQSVASFTLAPVVAGVFVAPPGLVLPRQAGNAANPPAAVVGTYETTVFATDELGYVIPSIGASNPDNAPAAAPMITIAPTTSATALSFNKYPGQPSFITATSLLYTFAPPNTTAIAPSAVANVFTLGLGASDFGNITGVLFADIIISTPNSVTQAANTVGQFAGTGLNVVCGVNNAAVSWAATIQSAAPAASVVGYKLTPGTNYPSNTAYPISLPTVDCSPGIGGVIN